MLTHATDPSCYLIEIADFEQDPQPDPVRENLGPLRQVLSWAREYLTRPHPELGREGPVCPYSLPALRKGSFYLTVRRGHDVTREKIYADLLKYRDWFLELEPREGNDAIFKTILILYPDVPPESVPRLIDGTQESLKGEYVQEGLMIGEFHSGPPRKAGLWNPDFRPLKSPIPMLVIRHMVPTDFGFLRHDKGFVLSYLERFRDQIPTQIRREVRDTALELGILMPELEDMAAVHPRVRRVIESRQLSVRVLRHRDLRLELPGPAGIAQALGYPLERISKSVLLRCQCHGRYAIATASVSHQISLARIAEHLGCSELSPATDEEILAILGVSPGGVCPIAAEDLPVLIDDGLLRFPTVLVAAGEIEVELEMAVAEILRITGAESLSFADPIELEASPELAVAGPAGDADGSEGGLP